MGKEEPLVSIVVPTYNSRTTLKRLLESIKNQTYKNIEVIIVDNYSTDGTAELARKMGAKVILARSERAKAKNIGLKEAKGDYVLFIDSDMELTPRVVEEAVAKASTNNKIGGIIIPEITVGNTLIAKIRRYERKFYEGTAIESARFFPRELALRAGGYDEDIVFYEEATLPLKIARMGYDVTARINQPIIHHEENLTLIKLLKKKYYYAKTAKKYLKRYPELAKNQVSPLKRYWIFISNPKFWKQPHLALAVLGLKTLEYAAAALGYITSLLKINNRLK